MQYRTQIEIGAGSVAALIGLVLVWQAVGIDPRSYDAVGPRFVPLFVACAMVALGAFIAVRAWMADGRDREPMPEDYGFRDSDLARVGQVVGTGIAYLFVFWAFGYFAATLLGIALMMLAFGIRSPLAIGGVSAVTAVIYQFVFIGLMGLLDAPGAWLDLRPFTDPLATK
ncbi:MAG: tripartite tricarboxylate transporter TctB family protein [Pseudomonadota bacterium]